MDIKQGKAYYFYDNDAVDCVCKAHVLHILPHPERVEDDKAKRTRRTKEYIKAHPDIYYQDTCFKPKPVR